jgi:hypothetical protein
VEESTRLQRRQHLIREMAPAARRAGLDLPGGKEVNVNRPPSPTRPEEHHSIASSLKTRIDLGDLVNEHPEDPAFAYFVDDLQNHLLARLNNVHDFEPVYTDEERSMLNIQRNQIYPHSTLRVNYTTYDMYRDQDVIKPSVPSRSFIITTAPPNCGALFWYGRVLGIYHTEVTHPPTHGHQPQKIQFLHVRWMVEDPEHEGSFRECRLDRLSYHPVPRDAYSFLDPSLVIRGCFTIPGFQWGRDQTGTDWDCYYAIR